MSTPKLERLLDLIAELLHTERPLTADELHQRIPGYPADKDSFKRSFERDKKDLREMHIPLRIEDVPGRMPAEDGYRIDRDEYGLPDPGLDADELAALHLAANAVRLDGSSANSGLLKLGGAPGGDVVPTNVAVLPSSPHLSPAFEAVGGHRTARFRYRDKDRTIDPFRLHHERGHWYLQGHDHDVDETRLFRLDRIEGDIALGDVGSAVEPDHTVVHPPRLDAWALGDDAPIQARIRVRPPQATIAARSVGEHVPVHWEPDGAVVLELAVTRRDGFRSFVLGFLDDVEIIEPAELRDDLVAWLQSIIDASEAT